MTQFGKCVILLRINNIYLDQLSQNLEILGYCIHRYVRGYIADRNVSSGVSKDIFC